ncbi:hypothetical protein OTU49_004120 [Cherax quadricarinatus]|uniref:HIG1 domain-containing protein n=1 Tax=Cherax quadricarinatus TaxID=27406 RepID=A0AAW0X0W8_CHEQU|nr:HIG1 domain family member 2A, mitochondrial-like [Cherax quadricarinatus]XP_053630878.1 HIG1 domain family member 2A, mitochondrial-like [Cherax quadricarinatus]
MVDDKTNDVSAAASQEMLSDLDWITLKKDIGSEHPQELSGDKFKRKFQENPFVPVGCGLTTAALCYGLWSFSSGQRKTSQNMMRFRVFAQGFTVIAMMLGIVKASLK